ncbi:TetR/AcrR family transcriptional regulator [Gangjinia marincola]|uniref:TetR/AcrR family transcriptional regulator n=1 Tax=Gangjinia marincola TaxID=578463 RepID=A0ABP3XQH1_9FLAO
MRDEILKQSTDLFLERGFKSVTMDDIAQDMAISKKTIYQHFKNKTILVEESVETLYHLICNGIDHITQQRQNPIEELYEIKKFVLMHLKGEKSSPIYQLQKYYPRIHASIRKRQFEHMQDCMIDNIKRGIAQGLFRENLNVEFVSRIYFIGMTGIKDNDMFDENIFHKENLLEMYLEYHLRGIVTPKGRKRLNQLINSNHE